MKNWNKTGKIKALLLILFCLPNLIAPFGVNPQYNFMLSTLFSLIFGSLAIPFVSKFNSSLLGREITKPNWNDNPLNFKNTLTFAQFGAYFFISGGLSMIIGVAIKYHFLSNFGVTTIFFGIGMLIGIRLTLMWFTKK